MVALALGCGLRYGEIAALRHSDLPLSAKPPVVGVRRVASVHEIPGLPGGWSEVRTAVGRPINFHDLRATGATRLAQTGAHVAEVQVFLGDSSSQAAERYVRATQSRVDDLTTAAFAGLDFGTSGR